MNKLMPKPYLVLVRRGKQYALLPQLAFSARDARDQARTELDAEFEGTYLSRIQEMPQANVHIVAVSPLGSGERLTNCGQTPVSRRNEMLETFARFETQGTFAASQIAELLRNYDL